MALKIVVLGNEGQVGSALTGTLGAFAEVKGVDRADFDIGDAAALRDFVRSERPQAVVNAAAYTDVDAAEADEPGATRINAGAVAVLGEECHKARIALLHYSTDFVFDGASSRPYTETDAVGPLGAYGRSKLAGEKALAEMDAPAIVLRTAWVYSVGRRSFVSSILRLAREREALRIVDDQVGSPTFAWDLACATALILFGMRGDVLAGVTEARGVYHLAGEGAVSRFALAKAVVDLDPRKSEHRIQRIDPIATSDYPLPAARPAFAPLDCRKARQRFGVALPAWRDALVRALRQ
jgi:dTDP-4-dehydrorhamnose reductase